MKTAVVTHSTAHSFDAINQEVNAALDFFDGSFAKCKSTANKNATNKSPTRIPTSCSFHLDSTLLYGPQESTFYFYLPQLGPS